MSRTAHSLIDEFRRQWEMGAFPDARQFVATHGPKAPAQLTELLMLDQSQRWQRGEPIAVADYFSWFPELLDHREHAIDLLFSEFLFYERFKHSDPVNELAVRFPQFADELRQQIELHRAIEAPSKVDELKEQHDERLSTSIRTETQKLLPEIPGYEILGELGRGGIGVVYKARHLKLNRPVAIKMLLAGHFASANVLRRFLIEAEATARLQHPNIVQIYEVGQCEGRPFLVLEYVNGGTLSQLTGGRPQGPRDAARLIQSLADAVQFAHDQGVWHRDLKPGNVLIQNTARPRDSTDPLPSSSDRTWSKRRSVTESRLKYPLGSEVSISADSTATTNRTIHQGLQFKVADFGLAKLVAGGSEAELLMAATLSGDILGTAAYMSPEQALGKGDRIAGSTDVYSLGAILYELLTGRPPFVGIQPLEVLGQVVADEPVRPSNLVRRIPNDIQTICLKCLEKSPDRRYGSAAELADDLQRFLANQPILARHHSTIERGWRWCRRNPVKTSVVASLATILLLLTSVSSVYSLMLGKQLKLTSEAQNQEQSAKIEALSKLWESKLSHADLLRISGLAGQRFEGLHALTSAQELGNSIEFNAQQIQRMRNTTLACLAQPDFRIASRWSVQTNRSINGICADQYLDRCANSSGENDIVVCASNDGHVIARIDAPNSKAMMSADGEKLAVLSNDACKVYCIEPGESKLVFEALRKGAWSFTGDGQKILGADNDGLLSMFRLQDGQVAKTFPKIGLPSKIAVSPDSQWAAMVDDKSKSVQVINLETGELKMQLPPVVGLGKIFAWHPNSRFLAIGPYADGIVIWNVATGSRLTTLAQVDGEMDFCFSSTGDRLLTYNIWRMQLNLWNVSNRKIELSQTGQVFAALSPSRSGGFHLLQQLDTGQITHVVVESPRICRVVPIIHESTAETYNFDLAFSGDGRLLALAHEGSVDIFSAQLLFLLGRLVTGPGFVQFDAKGSLLTLNKAGLYQWPVSQPESLLQSDGSTANLAFGPPQFVGNFLNNSTFEISRDSKTIAVTDGDGALIWKPESSTRLRTNRSHPDVRRLSLSPDGRRLATGGWNGGKVCIWDTASGELIRVIPEPDCCLVHYSPNGKWLVTNSDDVRIRDAETDKVLHTLHVLGRSSAGVFVCFSPDSNMMAVSDANGEVHLFDPATGVEFAMLTTTGPQHVCNMAFDPEGNHLAVLSASGSIGIWDLVAIHDELKQRGLDWSKKIDSVECLASGARESNIKELKPIDQVDFLLDERFRQVEAEEQVLRARAAAEKFDFESARAALARAIELQPSNPSSCNDLAWLLVAGPLPLRDPITALDLAQGVMKSERLTDNERPTFANTLGVACYRAERFEEAIEMLQQSLAIQPPETQAFDLLFLSMCHARLGDTQVARSQFDQAQVLLQKYQAQLPYVWQTELIEFSREAQLLLK